MVDMRGWAASTFGSSAVRYQIYTRLAVVELKRCLYVWVQEEDDFAAAAAAAAAVAVENDDHACFFFTIQTL